MPFDSSFDSTKTGTSEDAHRRILDSNPTLFPLFGIGGCGKARVMIELLSNQWGVSISTPAATIEDLRRVASFADMDSLLNHCKEMKLAYEHQGLRLEPCSSDKVLVYDEHASKLKIVYFGASIRLNRIELFGSIRSVNEDGAGQFDCLLDWRSEYMV